ncbi:MAG: FAD-dependent oxidoreductase [Alphaproteobacteria bacterium]|nr:FAD-dependent oxidoreductase [Alphaproteobacteria bacterium]
MDRRHLLRNSLALGGVLGMGGCAGQSAPPATAPAAKTASTVLQMDRPPVLAPVRAHADRFFDFKVCLRPFRTKGPRLDVEQIGDALVVHNYGHGGSGWSLSWGSAEMAVEKALSGSPKEVAVIGSGIIGLTSAITAQRAGAQVTIYTRELLPRTRSVRANGSWTPDSRIALAGEAPANFGDTWEQMARISWKNFRPYIGMAGNPIAFADHYYLTDAPRGTPQPVDATVPPLPPPTWTGAPTSGEDFAKYSDRIRDITPYPQQLEADINPFPVKYASRTTNMFFNFTEYGHLLTTEFFARGGKIVMRDFHSPSELGHLPQKVVINCPGFAARDWWQDKAMVPVRGQTGWLIPQPEVNYGLTYRNVQILSKSDGIMVIALENGELKGYNNSNESVNRVESENAVKVIDDLFARFPVSRA